MSLLSATSLGATYDPVKKELSLSAEVILAQVTFGIVFRRIEPWVGAYKFALEGFQTDPQPKVTESITRHIPMPDNKLLLQHVVICTQEFPDGEVVPVHWLGLAPPEKLTERTAAPSENTPEVIPTVVPMKVLDREAFQIMVGVETFVFLDKFDERFLQLLGVNIVNNHLIYKFLPLVTGSTHVQIRSSKALGGPVFLTDYLIDIILPGVGPVKLTNDEGEILSYVGKVNVLLDYVKSHGHPEADVHSVRAFTHNTQSGVDSIGALFDYFVTFRVKIDGEEKFFTKEMIGENIQTKDYITPVMVGLPDLKWPVEFQAEEALKMLKERGVDENFVEVSLTMTIGQDPHFPSTWLYTFRMVDGHEEQVQLLQ